jgi:hypothetical protein
MIPQPPADVVFFQDTTAQICYPDGYRDNATARGRAMGNQAHAQFRPKPNIRVTRGNSVKIRLNLERRETILLYNSRDYSEWSPYQNAIEKTFEPFFAL